MSVDDPAKARARARLRAVAGAAPLEVGMADPSTTLRLACGDVYHWTATAPPRVFPDGSRIVGIIRLTQP